ncbi:unnamed protein product, partial [Polarella glacialis]
AIGRHRVKCVERATELLARPGTKVCWLEKEIGGLRRGVVCGASARIAAAVEVLNADGRKQTLRLQDLRPAAGLNNNANNNSNSNCNSDNNSISNSWVAAGVPGVGALVLCRGQDPQSHRVGMCAGVGIRLQGCTGDLHLSSAELAALSIATPRAWDALRPGAAVRLVGNADEQRSDVGVVYSIHADGSAVVDFWSRLGHHCSIADLEVLPECPSTLDHQALCILSELLAWTEVSAQLREEQLL